MEMQELSIRHRESTGKQAAKRLRRAGVVPAVLYGGATSEAISVDPRAVLRIIHGHAGSTQLVNLTLPEGNGAQRMAVIRDLQFDPVTERLLHVDLQEVAADRPITVVVAIYPVGEAAGVRDQKGILNRPCTRSRCPACPHSSPSAPRPTSPALMIGDVLTVRDLRVPEGVRVLTNPDQAVAIVSPPMAEEVVAAAPPQPPRRQSPRCSPSANRRRRRRETTARGPESSSPPPVGPGRGGAGEPGPEYRDTRHSVGQRVVDALARTFHRSWSREGQAMVARAQWRGESLYLVKPLTFMNVSGPAVARVLRTLGADPAELILVYDDLDLALGAVRVRMKGSHGGHRGVRSVIEALGTSDIRRVKVGIGRPEVKADVPDHVLSIFDSEELALVETAVATACDRVLTLLHTPRTGTS